MDQILAAFFHFKRVRKKAKRGIIWLDILDILRFVVLMVFLMYCFGEVCFRLIGTENRRLVNIKC